MFTRWLTTSRISSTDNTSPNNITDFFDGCKEKANKPKSRILILLFASFALAGCKSDTSTNHNHTPSTPSNESSSWSNVEDWTTYQGNAKHTAYIPVSLDPTQFSLRWSWFTPDTGNEIGQVAIANNTVYVTSSGYNVDSNLYALAENDKAMLWQANFGTVPRANPPATAAGNVYVTTSGHSDTFMWSFDATTGNQLSKTAFSSQWPSFYAPTVDETSVYTNGGYYGGVNAFYLDGSGQWFQSLNQYDEWTPAVDSNYLYAYEGESCSGCYDAGLSVIEKSTGTLAFKIPDLSFDWKGWSLYGSPVIASNNSVIVVNGRGVSGNTSLISFDIANQDINWSETAEYWGNPALANGVIYATNNNPYQLEARDENTGSLLWSWQPQDTAETSFTGDVVATNNLVFISTNMHVYAIDMTSHTPVWSYSKPGEMAISKNGILYIATRDSSGANEGRLDAVNLK